MWLTFDKTSWFMNNIKPNDFASDVGTEHRTAVVAQILDGLVSLRILFAPYLQAGSPL